MAIELDVQQTIPATALTKVHISTWLQTEETVSPYTIRIHAEVILYGYDENGVRVYDPTGVRKINITDLRAQLAELIAASTPEVSLHMVALNEGYVNAQAYIVGLETDYGSVTT